MNNKVCSKCGGILTSEDIFCPECGTEVSEGNEFSVEHVKVKTSPTQPPPPCEKLEVKNSEEDYESDTSVYYIPPIDEEFQELPVTGESIEEIYEAYDSEEIDEKIEQNYYNTSQYYAESVKEESKEFDPFKHNADAKTTAYGDHTRKTGNILLIIIVLFLIIMGIVLGIVLH